MLVLGEVYLDKGHQKNLPPTKLLGRLLGGVYVSLHYSPHFFCEASPAGTGREIVCPIKICDFEGIGSLEMIHNAFHMNLFHQPPRIPEMFLGHSGRIHVPFPSRRVKN